MARTPSVELTRVEIVSPERGRRISHSGLLRSPGLLASVSLARTTQLSVAPPATSSLEKSLREETREAQRSAERHPLLRRLVRGEFTRETYAEYLVALCRVYAALETGLRRHRDLPALAPLHWPELWRGEALARDLAALLGPSWREHVAQDMSADNYVERLKELSIRAPALLVAHAYTRYLSDLTCGQLLRDAVLLLTPEAVSFYEFPQLADLSLARRSFRARLDALPLGPRDEAAIVAEARLALALNTSLLDAFT